MWIDLNERKPDSGEQVKILEKDGSEHWAYRGHPPCTNCWYSPFGGELICVPTHWHPIPEEETVDTSKTIDFMEAFYDFK